VLATSIIGGAFAVFSAVLGVFFGTFVDRHRKHTSMVVASAASVALYSLAALLYSLVEQDDLLRLRGPFLWMLVALVLAGAVSGNLRAIALSTTVTLLVPEDQRDRANGMIGAVTGGSIVVTSLLSGLVVGRLGMGWALVFAVAATSLGLVHLLTIRVPEELVEHDETPRASAFDFSGALGAVRATPGLFGLIGFAAFNNLLGGVFMSLMDAYGLSLVSVETWGILWAVVSFGFIAGGAVVARHGLGSRPMRVILVGNAVNWIVCIVFPLQASIAMLAVGMVLWMSLVPVIEAAEQTVLQQVVPLDHQGRVFGLAQTVENAASPLTSFMIGPIAHFVFIPFMTDGSGVDLIGGWFGVGSDRGLALIFMLAGVLGLGATLWAGRSRWYRNLARSTDGAVDTAPVVSAR
jgi:DHA3 family multidrug efflux protein-like MFS transporter